MLNQREDTKQQTNRTKFWQCTFLPASDFRGLPLFFPFSGSSLPSSSAASSAAGTAPAPPPLPPPPQPDLAGPHKSFDCTHRRSRFASADEGEGDAFAGDGDGDGVGAAGSGSADPPIGTSEKGGTEWGIGARVWGLGAGCCTTVQRDMGFD